MERGAFRPVTNVTWEMLQGAQRQFRSSRRTTTDPVVLMEMTLSNLVTGHRIDHGDFLARASMLNALGITVMVSNYDRFDLVTSYLRRYTKEPIVMVMGAPTLVGIFEENYYAALPGGILEGLGRLFQGDTTSIRLSDEGGARCAGGGRVSLPLAPLVAAALLVSAGEWTDPAGARIPRRTVARLSRTTCWRRSSRATPRGKVWCRQRWREIIRSRGLFGFKVRTRSTLPRSPFLDRVPDS
jgi:hypothetical protein